MCVRDDRVYVNNDSPSVEGKKISDLFVAAFLFLSFLLFVIIFSFFLFFLYVCVCVFFLFWFTNSGKRERTRTQNRGVSNCFYRLTVFSAFSSCLRYKTKRAIKAFRVKLYTHILCSLYCAQV